MNKMELIEAVAKALDTSKAHGSPLGDAEIRATKEMMGFDPDATFAVSDLVRAALTDYISVYDSTSKLAALQSDPVRKSVG